ncbi:flagella synthesis protein FlgN [Novimethylophilus kurashikiensis]|uniref:Flagella synthesis protein FlgN n=1 Tax=Novimethylophilus kurashikiensis TaxID=1825523 RepID=A0A2R5F791_9PROT|nr:flagellar protein FlgN [Novimethylophilus kurashikiensis]GBG14100.1 flagella synthesis protein FlgN [Novimethylophilus kurashikiensis]
MKSHDSASDRLIATLLSEAEVLRSFKSLLNSEQQAILAGEVESLENIAQSKLQLVEQLNRFSAERQQFIISLGIGSDRASMQQWADNTGNQAREAWTALLHAAEEAQQANSFNGALIQTHLQHNQQALAALLAAANQASLYGPDGQKTTTANPASSGRSIIGKA